MRNLTVLVIAVALLATPLCAEETERQAGKRSRKALWYSLAALGMAAVLDVHSSYGKFEANPLARSPNGRLGMRGVGIKLASAGGLGVMEYLLIRRTPEFGTAAAAINFGVAGAWTGVALRNYRIRKPEAAPKPIGIPAAVP